MVGVLIIVYVAIFVLLIASSWKVFVKAGEPGWAVLVPIYGAIVQLRIVGRPWWWLLLYFIPIVGLVFAIIATNDLAKSFGKSAAFTVGLIFLSFIFMPILGFGSAQYRGKGALLPTY